LLALLGVVERGGGFSQGDIQDREQYNLTLERDSTRPMGNVRTISVTRAALLLFMMARYRNTTTIAYTLWIARGSSGAGKRKSLINPRTRMTRITML
jgi:hypothetical protein